MIGKCLLLLEERTNERTMFIYLWMSRAREGWRTTGEKLDVRVYLCILAIKEIAPDRFLSLLVLLGLISLSIVDYFEEERRREEKDKRQMSICRCSDKHCHCFSFSYHLPFL